MDFWPPVIVPKEQIDDEIDRLASIPRPADGRRESLIVHPNAAGSGAFAPGIQVRLCVLRPGEATTPIRHNSTQLGFCIQGSGQAHIEGQRISFGQYDVWNHPSYRTYWHENDTDSLQVRLEYSNAPVLEKLHVHLVDEHPPRTGELDAGSSSGDEDTASDASPFGAFRLTDDGAWLMPYELLINPPPVESAPLHWPWGAVQHHLEELGALGDEYRGRRLYLLYNPATGRTNGTTPAFFATMTIRPPGIVDRPHRHVSAAINYYFHGSGRSVVNGQKYTWQAGDLMLSAPGWATHHHASDDDSHVHELTVQDQPFHIAIESLLWQEDLKRPARVLGTQPGFSTNRNGATP
jgi:gentisate 1,2-dioxygenase